MIDKTKYIDFYKDIYYREVDRRNQINNSLSTPIGLITASLTIQFYFLTNYKYEYLLLDILFGTTALIALLFSLKAIYSLLRAYSNLNKGYETPGLPVSSKIENYRRELLEFHDERLADQYFQEYLLDKYINHADRITEHNDNKLINIFSAKKSFSYSVAAILIQALWFINNFFYVQNTNKKSPVIVNTQQKSILTDSNRIKSLQKDSVNRSSGLIRKKA